jgi:hypothetical protein
MVHEIHYLLVKGSRKANETQAQAPSMFRIHIPRVTTITEKTAAMREREVAVEVVVVELVLENAATVLLNMVVATNRNQPRISIHITRITIIVETTTKKNKNYRQKYTPMEDQSRSPRRTNNERILLRVTSIVMMAKRRQENIPMQINAIAATSKLIIRVLRRKRRSLLLQPLLTMMAGKSQRRR